MIGSDSVKVERLTIAILRILEESTEAIGARVVARHLKKYGIALTERAVRYHLKLMDARGLTRVVGREGRLITLAGVDELRNALVDDKVSLVISQIEALAFRTTFDCQSQSGLVPLNISLFAQHEFPQAVEAIRAAFEAGVCVSNLVAAAGSQGKLGDAIVPQGKAAFGTVSSTIVNGALLKAGIPVHPRFGGLLQIRDYKPFRFVELIQYGGSSLEPSAVFIKGRMTRVVEAARRGEGRVIADLRDIPSQCRPMAERVIAELKKAHLVGLVAMGNTDEPVCRVRLEPNRVGIVVLDGLNVVAAAEETGLEAETIAMTSLVDYNVLQDFSKRYPPVAQDVGHLNASGLKALETDSLSQQ